jgi:integrase
MRVSVPRPSTRPERKETILAPVFLGRGGIVVRSTPPWTGFLVLVRIPTPISSGETDVRVSLRGINTIRKRLADGTVRTYYYHRSSGERIKGQPGSPEFIASLSDIETRRKKVPEGTFRAVIKAYEDSSEFERLSDRTKKDYRRYLRMIEEEFGEAALAVINDPRIRADLLEWRDNIAVRSARTADYAWSVLRRVIEWGVDRGKLTINRAVRGGRLYSADRADKLWLPEHVKAFSAIASPELQLAMALAMYTGQRQGDLLCLSWSNYDGQFIRLRQSKTTKRVTIKCGPVLNKILGAIKRRDATTILTSPSGRAWKADHFRHEWAEACKRAGITDLHFHDLRGTAVTLLSESGATPQEIASMTGWAYQSVETILERYSARTAALSAVAARRLEQALERTYGEQMLQTELQTKPLTKAGNGSK